MSGPQAPASAQHTKESTIVLLQRPVLLRGARNPVATPADNQSPSQLALADQGCTPIGAHAHRPCASKHQLPAHTPSHQNSSSMWGTMAHGLANADLAARASIQAIQGRCKYCSTARQHSIARTRANTDTHSRRHSVYQLLASMQPGLQAGRQCHLKILARSHPHR